MLCAQSTTLTRANDTYEGAGKDVVGILIEMLLMLKLDGPSRSL